MINFPTLKRNWRFAVIVAAAALIIVGIVTQRITQGRATQNQTASVPAVTLIPIKDYLEPAEITLDNGIVESASQADLRAQISAPISQVNAHLGDFVAAGQIIAVQKNDDIRAQLAQAQANLDAAKKGARVEDIAITQTQTDQAKQALINSIQDSYSKADDAIKNHADKFFANPESANLQFLVTINAGGNVIQFGANRTDAQRQVENEKIALISKMDGWQTAIAGLTPDNFQDVLSLSKDNLDFIIGFLNDLSAVANSLTTDNATYKQILDGYKTELSAARSTAAGTLAALQGTETGYKIAANTLALKLAGSTPEQLKLAQAAVDLLQAQLEKTNIRAPFSGYLSFLDARIGQLYSPGQLIATAINPQSLQITTYASENDLPDIAGGDRVVINDMSTGVVTRVSPAIDATTKKAKLIVAIIKNDPQSPVIVGQTVALAIQSKKLNLAKPAYLLPIQAVRRNAENYLFSVGRDSTVQQIPVTTGKLIGEKIEVTGDLLAPDLKIISSVSGLSAGDTVKIQE